MKKIIYSTVIVLALFSCGNKTQSNNTSVTADSETVETVETVKQDVAVGKNQTKEAAKTMVETTYNRYFATLQAEDESSDMDGYLTEDLRNLIDKGVQKQEATEDLFFDYDYWINAQDFDDLNVKSVNVIDFTPEKATAEVNFMNCGSLHKAYVVVKYNKEKDTWLIDDFLDPDTKASFAKSIKDYLSAPAEK